MLWGRLATSGRLLIGPHPAGESHRSPETRAHCAFTQHPWLLNRRFYDESALSFFEEVLLEEMEG